MDDVLVLGGGVIGLSLAWELSGRGVRVRVIDRGPPGREASWAGAGILPPGARAAGDPYLQLAGLSHQLHPQWAARLREQTGIDTGYRRCGGVYVARDDAQAAALREAMDDWRRRHIRAEALSLGDLMEFEPALRRAGRNDLRLACLLPDEAQLRNPWHLRALQAACERLGVVIEGHVAAEGLHRTGDRVAAVETSTGVRAAERYCICSGAWTGSLLAGLGVDVPIKPVRGQMVLLATGENRMRRIVHVGDRYLVPRDDGRILAGSTEEDAGFDSRTTAQEIAELLRFALDLAPGLRDAQVERAWAGLRPASADGMPYLGRLPGLENAYVAAGHFRSGLELSPGTAAVMAQLILGEVPEIDLAAFAVQRAMRGG